MQTVKQSKQNEVSSHWIEDGAGKTFLTACKLEVMEFSDDEQLTAVFLESQVTKPLKDHRHLLDAPVEKKSR